MTVRGTLLAEAANIVNGDRATVYGGPEDSFARIAALWTAYSGIANFTPTDVAAMLALVKVARIRITPTHWDSWVDLAGYAACGAQCATEKEAPRVARG